VTQTGLMHPATPYTRVVLVGFMTAGKTSVGRALARSVGWTFADSDDECVRQDGRSVARIFAESGEPTFRELEQEVMARLLCRDRVVIATGGGWAGRETWTDEVPESSLTVWLDVSPEAVLSRAERRPGSRPLLIAPDPMERVRSIMAERRPHYALAQAYYDTVQIEVEEIVRLLSETLEETEPRSAQQERSDAAEP